MKLNLLLSLLFFVAGGAAHAGEKAGNGGTVYDCDDGKAYLVDLREPSLRRGLAPFMHIEENEHSIESQIMTAFARIGEVNEKAAKQANMEWQRFRSNIRWRDGKYDWEVTADVGAVPVPDGCRLRNAIMYYSDREIEGQNEIRQRMSKTHQAALEVHEVLYKMMRDFETTTDAVAARRLTGILFSNLRDDRPLFASAVNSWLQPNPAGHPIYPIIVPPSIRGKNLAIARPSPYSGHRGSTRLAGWVAFSDWTGAASPKAVAQIRKLRPDFYGDTLTAAIYRNPNLFGRAMYDWVSIVDIADSDSKPKKVTQMSAAVLASGKDLSGTEFNPSGWTTRLLVTVVLVDPRLPKFLSGDLRP